MAGRGREEIVRMYGNKYLSVADCWLLAGSAG